MDIFIIVLLPRGSISVNKGSFLPMFDVIGGTCSCMDHVLLPEEQYPPKDEKTFLESYVTVGGGVSANALVFLSHLGLSTAFWGLAGKDAAGDYLVEELSKYGVNTNYYIRKKEFKTPQSFIIVDPVSGSRTIMAYQPSLPVKERDILLWKDLISHRPKCCLLDTHHLPVKYRMAQLAKEMDIPMVWDVGTYKKGVEKLFPYMDYFIAPDDFLEGYFGQDKVISEKDICDYLRILARDGQFTLTVITSGEKGAYAWLNGEPVHFPALKIPRVLDTTGAGDIFHAGFVYGFLKGWDIEQSLEWAVVCAGLSCTYIGGRPAAICSEDIVRNYKAYIKNRKRRKVLL